MSIQRNSPRRHTHFASDIVAGVVPPRLLGTNQPQPGLVLFGDGSWGALPPSLPPGGTTGQVLRKASAAAGDAEWAAPTGGGGNSYFPGGWA